MTAAHLFTLFDALTTLLTMAGVVLGARLWMRTREGVQLHIPLWPVFWTLIGAGGGGLVLSDICAWLARQWPAQFPLLPMLGIRCLLVRAGYAVTLVVCLGLMRQHGWPTRRPLERT